MLIMIERKTSLALLLACLCLAPASVQATNQGSAQSGSTREVNITSDSASGWIPSEELEREARQAATLYFSLIDSAAYQAAYDMMSDGNKALLPFAQFKEQSEQFRSQAGRLRQRHFLKVTWTKDAQSAPLAGTYAAIDAAATFEHVDRQCGYLVLYQQPTGGAFKVARVESNFIDNATAETIRRDKSRAEIDRIWSALSRNCPNYPIPEASDSNVGYDTVAAALADLRSRRSVVFTAENGWVIATDDATYTIWSFAPRSYPAYPAVVKRQISPEGTGSRLQMSVLCEASKAACDDLVRTFERMNGFNNH